MLQARLPATDADGMGRRRKQGSASPPRGDDLGSGTVEIYAVTNWTEQRSHGPFLNESAAFEALATLLAPGDRYDVWTKIDGSAEVRVIDAGQWPHP